jgi:hypothetical protein
MKIDQTVNGATSGYFAVFDGGEKTDSLAGLSTALLHKQMHTWPALADGYAALEKSLIKEIDGGNWKARIQCNPRRIVSSGAKLDPETIKKRPCFLCPRNLPVEQEAILYREDYNLLCNPAPIFPGHLTIAARRHIPQELRENVETLLLLADDFGSGTTVFYNGPKAGASAPDHLHFQAAPSGLMPIEGEAFRKWGAVEVKTIDGVAITRTVGLARGVIVMEANRAAAVSDVVVNIMDIMGRSLTDSDGEPPLNIFCSRFGENWRLILCPRIKHRPDAFFCEGEKQIVVSPGAADMGGVVIAPRERDFHLLTAELIADIYREVAFGDDATEKILSKL